MHEIKRTLVRFDEEANRYLQMLVKTSESELKLEDRAAAFDLMCQSIVVEDLRSCISTAGRDEVSAYLLSYRHVADSLIALCKSDSKLSEMHEEAEHVARDALFSFLEARGVCFGGSNGALGRKAA